MLMLSALAGLALAAPAFAQGSGQPQREITKIAGDVYKFRNIGHNAIFMVTRDGIILVDPINADASKWLKDELKRQFDKPVKYVVYSHDHSDHISGGEVFADSALFVAHQNAKEAIIKDKRPTPLPNITFSESLNLELGGKRVDLRYVGRNHSDNSIVAVFPDERILFAVDWIPVRGLPFRELNNSWFEEWIDGLKRVEAMDFDILSPGHGPLGKRDDVRAFRGYMEDLRTQVFAAIRAGKTKEQAKDEIRLENYKDWGAYETFRPLNIDGMYEHARRHVVPNVPAPFAPAGAPKGN
jgi:glyoxylase-like metal-dependent hydrolase (beta-lactamase superfamily II)